MLAALVFIRVRALRLGVLRAVGWIGTALDRVQRMSGLLFNLDRRRQTHVCLVANKDHQAVGLCSVLDEVDPFSAVLKGCHVRDVEHYHCSYRVSKELRIRE